MVAVAPIRALHPAVAGKEVAAHAQCVAVRLVLADELARLHGGHRHDQGPRRGVGAEVRVLLDAVVEAASHRRPVADARKLSVNRKNANFSFLSVLCRWHCHSAAVQSLNSAEVFFFIILFL